MVRDIGRNNGLQLFKWNDNRPRQNRSKTGWFIYSNYWNNLRSYIDGDGNVASFSDIGTSEGGTIGAAEDGNYDDGLFQDFTTSTLIGVPIDRYNELFKSLVPPPAPNVSRNRCSPRWNRCKSFFWNKQ